VPLYADEGRDRCARSTQILGCLRWRPTPIVGSRARRHGRVTRTARTSNRRAALEHVASRPRQLVRQRLGGQRGVRCCARLCESIESGAPAHRAARKVAPPRPTPRQVAIAVSTLPSPCLLAVASLARCQHSARTRKVAGRAKAINGPVSSAIHRGQHRSNARHRLQQSVLGLHADPFSCRRFSQRRRSCCRSRTHQCDLRLQPPGARRRQPPSLRSASASEPLNLLAAQPSPRSRRAKMFSTATIHAATRLHQAHALARQIARGSRCVLGRLNTRGQARPPHQVRQNGVRRDGRQLLLPSPL